MELKIEISYHKDNVYLVTNVAIPGENETPDGPYILDTHVNELYLDKVTISQEFAYPVGLGRKAIAKEFVKQSLFNLGPYETFVNLHLESKTDKTITVTIPPKEYDD